MRTITLSVFEHCLRAARTEWKSALSPEEVWKAVRVFCDNANISDNPPNKEFLVLYGCHVGDRVWENFLGVFKGIAPGVVFFHSHTNPELNGFIRRCKNNDLPYIFELFSLMSVAGSSVYIHPSSWPKQGNRWNQQEIPIVVSWEGVGGDYGKLGITRSRWAEMEAWFNRWLPVE
jgi:hypothetical protein